MIITNNDKLGKKAKHLSTTAKVSHKWEFKHNMVGYNYRMPNLNAALLLAQLEKIDEFLFNKRNLAKKYQVFFSNTYYKFFEEPENCISNYWLNSIVLKNKYQRDKFLHATNSNGVMTRPIWKLMNELPMYKNSKSDDLINSKWLYDRLVNIPSSVTK